MSSLRLHAFEPASRANGPGLRAVLWVQGCTLGCPGCFNPGTHAPAAGFSRDTADLADEILARRDTIDGVSISGGEPFQQPEALLDFLTQLRGSSLRACLKIPERGCVALDQPQPAPTFRGVGVFSPSCGWSSTQPRSFFRQALSRLVFSGYTLREIKTQPCGPAILEELDVLIAGRYVAGVHHGRGLLGSRNQRIHLLTARHRIEEFATLPNAEIILRPDGSLTMTGIDPLTGHAHFAERGCVEDQPQLVS